MIVIVAESIEDLRQTQVRKLASDFIRGIAKLPVFDDSSHRRPCPFDHWLTAQHVCPSLNVGVLSHFAYWPSDASRLKQLT